MQSKNASLADNQQERLIGWILGFVDGEGCFSIGFVKQPNRKEAKRIRRGYVTGYQIVHEFAVTQGAKSLDSLKELKSFFKVGDIYINRRHDNHKEDPEWKDKFNVRSKVNNAKYRDKKKQEKINSGVVVRGRGRPRKTIIE